MGAALPRYCLRDPPCRGPERSLTCVIGDVSVGMQKQAGPGTSTRTYRRLRCIPDPCWFHFCVPTPFHFYATSVSALSQLLSLSSCRAHVSTTATTAGRPAACSTSWQTEASTRTSRPSSLPASPPWQKTGRRTCHVLLEHRHGHKLVPFDDYGELWLLDGEAQIRRRVWPVPGGDWCTSGPLARRAAAGTWGDCMHACFKRLDNKLMSTLTCSFHCTSDPFYAVDVLLPSVALTPTAVGRRLGQKAGGPPVRR